VVNSVLSTLHNSAALDLTITPDMVPPTVPFRLTTTFLKGLLPGIVKTYGADKNMTVRAYTHEPPKAVFQPGQLGGSSVIDFTFSVVGNSTPAVELTFHDLYALFDVTLKDFILTVQVNDFEVDHITYRNS